MFTVDLPLEELKKYKGTNPRPEDFDEYWDRGLSEMRSIEPLVELVPSKFQVPAAECFDMYFTGVKGARIHSKYLRPKNAAGPHPAVLMFHGYPGNSGDWYDKLPFVYNGCAVAAMDCRGQWGFSEDVSTSNINTYRGHIVRGLDNDAENMLYRQIYLDTAQLAGIIMSFPEVDENRVGAMGGSQGGGLTIACAALEPRIKRLATMYPFLCDYQRVLEMGIQTAAYSEIREYFRNFDPMHEREIEIFTKLGYIDVHHLAERVKGEVLMATGLMDDVAPPSTQFAAYNKIKSKKRMLVYPDFGHEGLPGYYDKALEFLLGL